MNKKDYLEKTKKLAKMTRILCRIAIIVSFVLVAMLGIALFLACVMPDERIKSIQATAKLSFLTGGLYVPADVFTSVDALRAFLKSILAHVGVGAAIFITVAAHVMGLLKSVEEGTPFQAQNVVRLRKISVAIIVGSILIPVVTGIADMAYLNQSLMDVKANSVVDITLLLCGILILILSGIFAYGARLQREHDETV